MGFDLKYFREYILNLTQSEFAEIMSKSQNTISRWEKEPENLTMGIINEISVKTGYSISDLFDSKPKVNTPLKADFSGWESLNKVKKNILDSKEELNVYMDGPEHIGISVFKNCLSLDNIYDNILKKLRKPRVAFLGNSDVGKSTLINSIIGEDILPAGWSPITSLIIKVVHIEDKPSFLNENTAVVLSKAKDMSEDIKLSSQDYIQKYCLELGNIEILEKYGSRKGGFYGKKSDAESIIIYLDSPILKTCELWDLPGYGTADDPEDDFKASKGKNNADIFVYMSLANAFMRGTDMTYLKDIIDTMKPLENKENLLKPLCNLFVVASQAHNIKPKSELENLIRSGSERTNRVMSDNYWDSRSKMIGIEHEYESFSKRFFGYTRDDESISFNFKKDFVDLLEKVPQALKKEVDEEIKNSITNFQKNILEEIGANEKYKNDMSKVLEEYQKLKDMQGEVYRNNEQFIHDLKKTIDLYEKESVEEFEEFYEEFIDEDSIVNLIEKKNYKNKRGDKEELQNYLNNTLNQKLKDIGLFYSEKLKEYLDKELKSLDIGINGISGFNYKRAFISGLAGLSTYGAFTLYMGTLGNLGGYILVTKAVGILSSLGISVGGGAVATSAVAAIGGPITIVLGLSVLATAIAGTLGGRNWDKTFAKNIVNSYKKQEAKKLCCSEIEKFWSETKSVINEDIIISEYEEKLKLLEEKLNSSDDDFDSILVALNKLYESTSKFIQGDEFYGKSKN